jgi:GT2 family glycosyltransferase
MTQDILFSVILPVYHSGHFLRQALRSLKGLTYPAEGFEVLVGGGEDDADSRGITTEENESALIAIRYIPSPSETKAGFLNSACRSAQGRYLVFTDDDCRFLPDWLERYESAFAQDPEIGMIGGPDVLEDQASGFDRALDYVLRSPLVTGRLSLPGSKHLVKYYPKLFNMAVPRSVVLEVSRAGEGGSPHVFDESLMVHEDVDLAKRIEHSGRGVKFCPEVRVKHFRDTSWRDFLVRNFRLGRACRTLRVHRLPQTLLSLLILGLGASLVSALVLGTLGGVVFLIPGAYVLMLAASAIHGSLRTRSPGALVRIPSLMAGLHISRGLGYGIPSL